MIPPILLDTHIVVWWLYEPKRLSREQKRVIENAEQRNFLRLSAMSLVEIATMNEGKQRLGFRLESLFWELDTNPSFQIMPITTEIAREVVALGDSLRDPGDRAIVATARVHGLQLVTSDHRIVESGLARVID